MPTYIKRTLDELNLEKLTSAEQALVGLISTELTLKMLTSFSRNSLKLT